MSYSALHSPPWLDWIDVFRVCEPRDGFILMSQPPEATLVRFPASGLTLHRVDAGLLFDPSEMAKRKPSKEPSGSLNVFMVSSRSSFTLSPCGGAQPAAPPIDATIALSAGILQSK